MSDYINIISQEAITAVPNWLTVLGGTIMITVVLSTFVYWAIVKDVNKAMVYLCIVAIIAIACSVGWICITNAFCAEPTGRYSYKATIDKDRITISQYEEFLNEYNPILRDGVYYFEGGPLNE